MSHISSSYAKILGETYFCTREIPRSGSKAKDGERKSKGEGKKRLNDGDNNGQATHDARKPSGPITNCWEITLCLYLPYLHFTQTEEVVKHWNWR